jgi:hypothetical protein
MYEFRGRHPAGVLNVYVCVCRGRDCALLSLLSYDAAQGVIIPYCSAKSQKPQEGLETSQTSAVVPVLRLQLSLKEED